MIGAKMIRRALSNRTVLWILFASVICFAVVEAADARVGGGNSYSGSSSSSGSSRSSGGSSSGGGDLIFLLLELCVRCPIVGIPLTITLLIVYASSKASSGDDEKYSSSDSHRPESKNNRRATISTPGTTSSIQQPRSKNKAKKNHDSRATLQSRFSQLRRYDPNFSEVLFMDFAYSIYAKAMEARAGNQLANVSSYLSKSATRKLAGLDKRNQQLDEIRGVIVGAASVETITSPHAKMTTIRVRFETNYTEVRGEKENAFYCEEIWEFARLTNVLSPAPERIKALGCPSCGSAKERNSDGSCVNCNVIPKLGKYHWMVKGITIIRRESRGPLLLSDVPEMGTDLPTIIQPIFNTRREQFQAAHPEFSWPRTESRFRHIFVELQNAWRNLDWEKARPYESDALFQFHQFWIQEYKNQSLRNILDDIRIQEVKLVKIESDVFFDALTVRIWASMKDYTQHVRGGIACGDPNNARKFSEYWTFIRRRGVTESAAKDSNCPNCGGPLKITMAGLCDYCDSKVTSGEFDWVLSRIEQDEAYIG
jgi:predicted lipid-binding transport protein (Tim44 family)